MSPRSRLRLSVESARSDRELADSQQFYQYTQHSPNTNRVFIDSKGQPHDPDFMSHMFPDQSAYKKRKMEAERARRASMGRLDQDDDDYHSDDDLMASGSNDPFRARSTFSYYAQPTRNHYSSSYGSSSYSPPTPTTSWQHTSGLLDENDDDDDDEDTSPTSERFSLRGWMKKKDADSDDAAWDATEKSRRVLRRRRRDLEELEEDDDENTNAAAARSSEDAEDCAPTCTEALKQSWQGFLLRYKLGTHRLKRRIFPRKPEPQMSTSPFLHSMEEKYIRGGT
ncbi:hypothetical protein FRC04_012152 [Tulasnella sp. 424]|nr:hypothetical protein FRC04_012152 [Tulasnella sp. 424]KAG8971040.1 hypothetical protein FRC05_011506 [Tulasnella sp. 425]